MPKRPRSKPIVYSGKLLYPTPVSINHRTGNPDRKGTYAFIHPQHEGHRNVRGWMEARREFDRKGRPVEAIAATEKIFQNLRAMAHMSDYFMKTVPPRTRLIRERLKKAGIRVEEPMMDLKDGKELFARGENAPLLISQYGIGHSPLRDCRRAIAQMIRMITRMHAAGVVHGHPHINNFMVDKKGRLTMIDLGMAKYYARQPRNIQEFKKRYGDDFVRAGFAMAQLLHDVPGTKWYSVEANGYDTAGAMVERMLKLHQKMGINTFNITARELLLPAA
ncbi:MAG: phosphotransferase [Candidatus Iainarchaeum archaeon]|uniref:Phosphotransferase n=1 Tax=Candidatus Iainarchaeum sp. TaxID=3101447 RepID=A0A7T9I2C8_9ARCH|nr:MAG: phosphotransferase [Candidatus Diapherotrites archaeon]